MLHIAMNALPQDITPEVVVEPLPLQPPQVLPQRKKLILGGVIGLIAGVAFLIVLVLATKKDSLNGQIAELTPTPTLAPERTERNYLLMGYGGGGHSGGKLTDTMIVVAIRPENKRITLISLPRDLWVPLPISEPPSWWKLNAAYAIGSDDRNYRNKPAEYTGAQGGGALASKVVSQFTNLQIDGYVTVNFATFISTVNLVNGISVPVERTFDDYQYPIEGEENNTCGKSPEELLGIEATASAEQAEKLFGCRYEHLHFDKGTQQMDGETALKFARSRHSAQDGNDFGRSERQKRVIIALKDKLLTVQFLPKLPTFVADLIGKVETNLGLNDALEFLGKKDEYSSFEIRSLAVTDKNVLHSARSSTGQYVLQPRAGEGNWNEIAQYIQDGLYATASSQLAPAQSASSSAKKE
jgi:LCP family protein required for cell wall assembly